MDLYSQPPKPANAEDAARNWDAWLQQAEKAEAPLAGFMRQCSEDSRLNAMLTAAFGNSPFLSHLALQHPELLRQIEETDHHSCFQGIIKRVEELPLTTPIPQLMHALRVAKAEAALLIALADITGKWPLREVTGALSQFAESALSCTINILLAAGAARGEISLTNPHNPCEGSGLIVLGMGKLGAGELNYSSDIDLIIFYEAGVLNYAGRHTEQKFFTKLAHDVVQIMQERTKEGYVFRTDLRLRPDPASTPPAVTTEAALYYYEGVGQNWERAAMIKAKPVAGDDVAGERFLKQIAPFMWRKNLDFAALQDIHSIKRQMDARSGRTIRAEGHNIKLGLGGIREIEFFAQIHQLIWGGREPSLRLRGTCAALAQLVQLNLIPAEKEPVLKAAYETLRTVEHRLQMIADQQTHELPETAEGLAHVAVFMGYENTEAFTDMLIPLLHTVHEIFAGSFQSSDKLGDDGNLVFTGVSHDPDTLETLQNMGFQSPSAVSETIMGWHHGSRRATRTKRAREELTELMPALLKRLSETANPDTAFLKFDEFLSRVPAGVQLFSLFTAKPELLTLIADIMGSAPVLAETLSKHPDLLESVLYGGFHTALPTREQLDTQLSDMLRITEDFEDRMERLRNFKNEKQFQAGVQLLRGTIDARTSGAYLSTLAEVILAQALSTVESEFQQAYGKIAGAKFAVIGLGKLGSREMTFGSDMDLVFIYDVPDMDSISDGEKGFTASVYYNRLAQRLLTALTTIGKEGRLYEVDTRLRPSGKQGLTAVSIKAMRHYFDELAWTFEFMALTKARPIAGDECLRHALADIIHAQLSKPRDAEKLKSDVRDMRERVAKELPAESIWDLKYSRGGLMDMDFICQYLLLRYAPTHTLTGGSSEHVLVQLHKLGLLNNAVVETLLSHNTFLVQLLNMLRLSLSGTLDEAAAMPGLKKLLSTSVRLSDFNQLKYVLAEVESEVYAHYIAIIHSP